MWKFAAVLTADQMIIVVIDKIFENKLSCDAGVEAQVK